MSVQDIAGLKVVKCRKYPIFLVFSTFGCLFPALSFAIVPPVNPLVGDWTAAGNGCRGTLKDPNSLSKVEVSVPNSSLPNSYVIKFTAHSMVLKTPLNTAQKSSLDPKELTQAAECSLRVALFPPTGKRIRNVTAFSKATVNKEKNFAGWVNSELSLGNQTIAETRIDYPATEVVRNRIEEFDLVPGRKEGQSIPISKCGQPRILAHNTIFAAERKQISDQSEIELGNNSTIEFKLDLEDCK
jgi:hypothetical protein